MATSSTRCQRGTLGVNPWPPATTRNQPQRGQYVPPVRGGGATASSGDGWQVEFLDSYGSLGSEVSSLDELENEMGNLDPDEQLEYLEDNGYLD
jgi:hypothetical protein